jgi:hypothetical protein
LIHKGGTSQCRGDRLVPSAAKPGVVVPTAERRVKHAAGPAGRARATAGERER